MGHSLPLPMPARVIEIVDAICSCWWYQRYSCQGGCYVTQWWCFVQFYLFLDHAKYICRYPGGHRHIYEFETRQVEKLCDKFKKISSVDAKTETTSLGTTSTRREHSHAVHIIKTARYEKPAKPRLHLTANGKKWFWWMGRKCSLRDMMCSSPSMQWHWLYR